MVVMEGLGLKVGCGRLVMSLLEILLMKGKGGILYMIVILLCIL